MAELDLACRNASRGRHAAVAVAAAAAAAARLARSVAAWRGFDGAWPARLLLAALAILLVVLVAILAAQPARQEAARRRGATVAAAPASAAAHAPPAVDPVVLLAVDPATARAINAKVPFSTAPDLPARPYRTLLAGDDLLRAVDCLAAGAVYEAGDDPPGEAAVAQVVLNRARHPAFPHSVCGVVFQGSERTIGCQFTFTCDGALARVPTRAAWTRAQAIALAALTGSVARDVGLATHYHTDWVVPYWSGSLDKIAALHTHLFFRWRGWWGTPPAFSARPDATEPRIAKLALLSDAHKDPATLAALQLSAIPPDLPRDATVVPAAAASTDPAAVPMSADCRLSATGCASDPVPSAPTAPVVAVAPPPAIAAAPAPRKRADPCAALRHVDDRIGFCAGR